MPVPVLKIVFRAKVRDGLKRLFRAGKLLFAGQLAALSDRKAFLAFLEPLCEKEWVVYAKAPFRGPDHLLQYLARYTHRVAISNHRLLAFDGESVTFRWKDYAHGNKKRKMTISADEFLRRFLLHTLPRGFVRIRFFGFLAGPRRSKMLQLARQLLQVEHAHDVSGFDPDTSSFPVPGLRHPDDRCRATLGGEAPPPDRRHIGMRFQRFLVTAAKSWRPCNGLGSSRYVCPDRSGCTLLLISRPPHAFSPVPTRRQTRNELHFDYARASQLSGQTQGENQQLLP